jgi:predicted CXXCH cytochrome family protein
MIQKNFFRNFLSIHFFFIFLILAGNVDAETLEPPKNPNSAKGCAICHYRWIDTFFVEGRGTDLVPYESRKVEAEPEMCISCHDGSVMDSRARVLHGKAHKTNMKPPDGMKIPAIFPLDENGKVQCATCHTAHGVESGPGVKETIFLRVSNKDSAMCRTCHPDKDGGPDAGNHTIGVSEKAIPLNLKMSGAHEGSQKNQLVCETCHTAHGSTSEGYLLKGAGDCGLCLECHVGMNMFDPSGQRNANHAFNIKPLIATVPETIQKKGAKMGYDGVITCQTCHKIHNNKIKQPVLLIQVERESDLCLTCHPDKKRIEKTKHNLAISAKEEKNLEGETVADSGTCSACHLPHKAARKPYEKEGTDRTTALCLSCHVKGTVAANEKLEGYCHPVNVALTEMANNTNANQYRAIVLEKETLDLPLFNDFGVHDQKGKMTCATCHDTHGGPEIQNAPLIENGEPSIKNTLLRKASPEICRACHLDKFAIENSRHDLNIVFPDGNKILNQKVPESDLCRNCHLIHSLGQEGFIWSNKITTETSKGFNDMCTGCHEKDGLAPEMIIQGNSHPVNISLSDKTRTTTLPLFDTSGKMTDRGVMTCYTCHDPHRRSFIKSENGDYVSIKGRPLNRFLRIDVALGSELCVNCHGDKADVIKTDHNLAITAPKAKNTTGRTPFESGVCGACHLVHNSKDNTLLWARDLGIGDNLMDRMCNSCHVENGVAANKVPQISSHPETMVVDKWKNSMGSTSPFPLFDKKTGVLVKASNISCPTCHDAHHWMGNNYTEHEAINTEGNALTSFLRPHLADQMCKDCHGIDALFKFKYFHKASERKK